MNVITVSHRSFAASSNFSVIGFGRVRANLQGMMSGFEAYKVYTALDAMSDSQLKAKGMDRAELPAIAMKTFTEACKA
ncbi:MAG: hypothetical protein ACJAVT_000661 [Yoonia sp.]|jgi:hypothetical protein